MHNLLVFPALGKQSPSRVSRGSSRRRNFVLRGTDRRTNAGENLFRVQRKDFESRSKAARLADESLIRSTVQSISDEVEALWEHYNWEIGPHLDSFRTGATGQHFSRNPILFRYI